MINIIGKFKWLVICPLFVIGTRKNYTLEGEQTYCRNDLLDKVSKTVLGHNVENIFPNWHFGSKCRILLNSINR